MLKNKYYVCGDDRVTVPSHLNYGKYMLDKFSTFRNNVAVIDSTTGKSITFAELSQLTVDIALSLARIGVKKGDVISVCSEERIEYMATALGIICAGATFTSTDVTGKATIVHRAQLVKPKIIFCSEEAFKTHKEALQSVGCIEKYIIYEDEEIEGTVRFKDFLTEHGRVEDFVPVTVDGWSHPAVIFYSSGTTGLPKGVPLTHLNVIMDMLTLIDIEKYTGKIVLTATEFYTFGLTCLHAGSTIAFIKKDEAKCCFEAIQKYKVKILQQMPSTIFEMMNSPTFDQYDLSSLERILSASAPLIPELVETIKQKLPHVHDIFQIYGATEAGAMCGDERASKGSKPGSVGCANPAVTIKVADPSTGKPVGEHERGEICFRSPSLFPGYIGSTSRDYLDEEGFYKTGDIGYYDEDKYFYIVDRIKDMIKYHGFAIAPAELESVLIQHPAVHEVAVVGAPDAQYFELATGFVVLKPGSDVTAEQLTEFVNNQVAEWMPLAGGVRFLPALPRGGRNKVDRKALRRILQS